MHPSKDPPRSRFIPSPFVSPLHHDTQCVNDGSGEAVQFDQVFGLVERFVTGDIGDVDVDEDDEEYATTGRRRRSPTTTTKKKKSDDKTKPEFHNINERKKRKKKNLTLTKHVKALSSCE